MIREQPSQLVPLSGADSVSELHTTSVDLSGLLQVLGNNLYSSSSVAVRELVQNAHDAIIRRQMEAQWTDAAAITLICDETNNTLTIEDNGSGLTRQEVLDYLATIGAGYTRVLRQAAPEADAIGYFGLGFLAAYVIASKVEVWTTSYQSPDRTWHFSSSGGQRFSLDAAETRPVGTRIVLHLNAENTVLAVPQMLRNLIERYCLLVPIPITLANTSEQINDFVPPWHAEPDAPALRRRKLRQDFAERFEPSFAPICSWDIGENELGVEGVIWIQDGASYASADNRAVSIFVRNMFISEECRELLPNWAGFMGCVINATNLTPTASREDVQRDDHFDAIKELVHQSVINGLKLLPTREAESWRRVTRRHRDALRGAAVADSALFDLLCDTLTVPTSQGELTFERILEATQGRLYLRIEDANSHETVLFKARHIPVVLGYRYGAAALCELYADRKSADLVRLGSQTASENLFPHVDMSPERVARLTDHLAGPDDRLKVARFEPQTIPFLFVVDDEARLKRAIEDDKADARIGAAALSLARLHTAETEQSELRDLIVNAGNPLIEQIAEMSVLTPNARHLVAAIRAYLLTLSSDAADPTVDVAEELNRFFESLTLLIEAS